MNMMHTEFHLYTPKLSKILSGFKACLLLGLVALGSAWAQERVLQASAVKTWTIDTARIEAFSSVKPFIDVSAYPPIDPNLIENMQIKSQGGGKSKDRVITVFEDGNYCVAMLSDGSQIQSFYYYPNGLLYAIQFTLPSSNILKEYKYSVNEVPGRWKKGQIMSVGLYVEPHEQYVFKPDGTMFAHWVGSNCFNTDGTSCGTRKVVSK